MKFLLYAASFILLDAIVPRSCRNEQPHYPPYYEEEEDSIEYVEEDEEMEDILLMDTNQDQSSTYEDTLDI